MKTKNHNQKDFALNVENRQLMKLKIVSVITMVLGLLSIMAVLFTYLALCDIGTNKEPDLTTEWNMVGIGLTIWIIFIGSTLITITYLFRINGKYSISG